MPICPRRLGLLDPVLSHGSGFPPPLPNPSPREGGGAKVLAERRMPHAACRMPNPEPRIPNPESRIPNPESRIPNLGLCLGEELIEGLGEGAGVVDLADAGVVGFEAVFGFQGPGGGVGDVDTVAAQAHHRFDVGAQ